MTAADVLVLTSTTMLLGALAWFFFGRRNATRAVRGAEEQAVEVVVKGGYAPSTIRATAGVPLRITFDRQERGSCTEKVLFPAFHVSADLPANHRTAVLLHPETPGRYDFSCGMNMVHGTLLVDPPPAGSGGGERAAAAPAAVGPSGEPGSTTARSEQDAAVGRTAEIRDLTRRVLLGAALTLPVLVAVMGEARGAACPLCSWTRGSSWR